MQFSERFIEIWFICAMAPLVFLFVAEIADVAIKVAAGGGASWPNVFFLAYVGVMAFINRSIYDHMKKRRK